MPTPPPTFLPDLTSPQEAGAKLPILISRVKDSSSALSWWVTRQGTLETDPACPVTAPLNPGSGSSRLKKWLLHVFVGVGLELIVLAGVRDTPLSLSPAVFLFPSVPPGSGGFPPGRKEGARESQDRPGATDQDVGICAEAGKVSPAVPGPAF